ncbi:hypothetical protein CANMA_003651 [Candida margitis]|uniref:uncharacterized protein n=1 Tax=Candida margitis TaxID=1775924 RepID=UPI0022272A96|nr:uncharacterized protein CANMA_003651 [Candida margitis]KAI5962876.1 hypothetical protein CANMA_003651 [Candida margitis]
MSSSSSPFKPPNSPIYIDDSLSPVKLPTRSPMKPPPSVPLVPHRPLQSGTPPVKQSTNTNATKLGQQQTLQAPYTEKVNKTTFLNINSAQRRSTIGIPKRSFSSTERPKLNLTSSSSLNKLPGNRMSITSPLHKRRKPANLSSIQRSAMEVELYMSKLNEDREERLKHSGYRSSMSEADELSSPIKRNATQSHRSAIEPEAVSDADELTEKRRKQVEDEDEDVAILEDKDSTNATKSVENIEVGRREVIDTAADLGAKTDVPKKEEKLADNDSAKSSDGDFEILGDNFSREPSQTLTHNQVTRLLNESKQNRYSTKTPDRMTEPQPQRPHPHHVKPSTVDNDQEEDTVLSPLRHDLDAVNEFQDEDQDDNELEDEPTMNFLDSPNSRPMFPLSYIEKLQSENERELSKLNEELKQQDLKINQLNDELSKQREAEHRLKHASELNKIQLEQLERNVASLTKRNTILESSNMRFKCKLIDYKITVNEVEEANRALTQKNDDLDDKFSKLQTEHSQMQREHIEFTMKMDDFENVKLKLVNEKQELLDKLGSLEQEYDSKIDHLEENVKLLEQSDEQLRSTNTDIRTQLDGSQARIEQLQDEKKRLVAINDENQDLVKELDHLISSTKQNYEDEIFKLKDKHEEKVSSLSSDLRVVQHSEAHYKELVNNLSEELQSRNKQLDSIKSQFESQTVDFDKVVSEKKHLESKLSLLQNIESDKNRIESELIDLKNKYENDLSSKEDEIYNLTTKHNNVQREVHQLKSTITDLQTQVKTQSQIITSHESDISTYKAEIDKLLDAITTLKQQLTIKESQATQLQQDIDALKINQQQELKLKEDTLVKYLHQEYSQKHTTKMTEVKLYYEQELRNRDLTIKNLNRDSEFLSKNLDILRQKYNELLGERAEQGDS